MRRLATNGTDVSVPFTVTYNHHFESNMVGAKSTLEYVPADHPSYAQLASSRAGHGLPIEGAYVVHDLAPQNAIPTSQAFGAANGGEVRKAFTGTPRICASYRVAAPVSNHANADRYV